MAKGNFHACHAVTAKWEGGWSDHKADPGGATQYGITIGTLSKWRRRPVTKAEVRALTRTEAEKIYKAWYWDTVQGDSLPAGIDLAVYDFSVNSGPGRAARYLQGCIGVRVDGAIGPQTIAACKQLPAAEIIDNLCDDRMEFLRALKTWKTFGKGWTNRVTGVRKEALLMAVDAHAPQKPKPQPDPASAKSGSSLLAILINLFKAIFRGGK